MTFRSFLTSTVDLDVVRVPFYIDVLQENGVHSDAITIENFLYRDEELVELCSDVVDAALVDTYLERSEELLQRFPTNALVLLSIAEAGASDVASLRASLALRELSTALLHLYRDAPLDPETEIKVCCAGAEVLFQYLMWLDLSEMILPILFEKVQLAPRCRDYLVMTAFRSAAVCDITREEDEGGGFYSEMRSILAEVHSENPRLMWEIHLADTVRTFIFDGPDAAGLGSMIATIMAAPLTEDQQFSIDCYQEMEPELKELFNRFYQPPTAAFRSNPARDLKRLVARQNLTSPEEIGDFIRQFMGKPIPEIPYEELTEDERAQDATEAILDNPREQCNERLLALTVTYPTSLWPWVGLTRSSNTPEETLSFADKGLALANEVGVDGHEEQYAELLQVRAFSFIQLTRYAEAIESIEQLLSVNELAMQDVGEVFLALLLRRGQRTHLLRADEVIKALQTYDEDSMPALPWLILLYRLITKRDSSTIAITLAQAMNITPHVGPLLANIRPEHTNYTYPHLFGDTEEVAIQAATVSNLCWKVYPDEQKKLKRLLQR